MNIRCERCSTIYELDEKLLAPEGSPVQCTKCQHVFTAVPPRSAGRTLVGVPAAPPPAPVAPPRAPTAAPPASATRQGPAIYKPSHAPAASSAVRPPRPQRDTMGAFEARLRNSARLRWIVPLAVAVVAMLGVGGWLLVAGSADPAAQRRHAEAMALVAQDDMSSLEKASQALDELSRQRTRIPTVDANRALAQLLLATGVMEDASPQSERLARKVAERDRLAAQPGSEGLAALSVEVEALRGQVEPRTAKAKALSERAYATLRQLSGERDGEVEVSRALAIHFASIGDRDQALRFIRAAGSAGERDPWIGLASGWLDAREESKEARERGAQKLTTLLAAHPEIVRARYLLARTQAALGRREQAAATLDGLLAANPGHQRARRLREELVVAAPPQQPAAVQGLAPRPVATRQQAGAPPAPPPSGVGVLARPVGPAPTQAPLAPQARPLPAPGVPPPTLSTTAAPSAARGSGTSAAAVPTPKPVAPLPAPVREPAPVPAVPAATP